MRATKLLAAVLFVASAPLNALQVNVVDGQDRPLGNAVVALYAKSTQPSPDQPRQAVMDQRDRQFVPEVLVVQTDTEVTFPNSDDIRHHVYSFSPAKRFELRLYHGTTAEPVTFGQAGKVVVGCNIHDSMLGYIYVVDTSYFGLTDARGQIDIAVPAGDYRLEVQHPRAPRMAEQSVTAAVGEKVRVNLPELAPDPRQSAEKTELEALFGP